MPDISCPTPDLPGDLSTAYLEGTSSARQSGLTAGQTFLTTVDTVAVDQDPDDRFTLTAAGAIVVNEPGFAVVDYIMALHRTSAALVTRCFVDLVVNATIAQSDGRYEQSGASHAAVSDAVPGATSWQTFHVGVASWFNAGDVIRPRVDIAGPGTMETLPNGDPLGVVGAGIVTAVWLGPGAEPYQGSVWP